MNKNIDIKNIKTAKRYAQALIQVASSNLDEITENLQTIDNVIFSNETFVNFFNHPIVSLKDKKDTIYETLNGKINEKTMNFIQTLLDENRFSLFKTINELYKDELDKIKNIQRISVTSAIPLNDDEKEKLRKKLNEKLKKEIILNYDENKDIIGGLIIKFEDKVIDLSIKNKLNSIKQNI